MTIRLTILRVAKNYYIGKNESTKKKYKILKNEHIRSLKNKMIMSFTVKERREYLEIY